MKVAGSVQRALTLGLAVLGFGVSAARADIILDTGFQTFAPTGTQFGRLNRNGVPSDWSGPKAFPGAFGAPAARGYEVFTINSGPYPFLQIDFDEPSAALFVSAYQGSYNPVNSPPNYGLDTNYLGDPGSSGDPFGNPNFFQIQVAPNTNVAIVINEVNPGGGTSAPFDLIVEGFLDTDFTGIPEPGAAALLGSVVLAAALRLARRRAA